VREPALPDGVPQPLDNELLAWAAGFFDGEGSTIARSYSRRPGYRQLEVGVPQSGHAGVPEVLTKFRLAMLSVGHIRPQRSDGMWKWSVEGRLVSELVLALMWPWLGTVKRAQASDALDVIDAQYADGRVRMRPARYRPALVAHIDARASDASHLDLAWAAGFLDAEGYFGVPKGYIRKDGTRGLVVRASATQHGESYVPADVLVRLRTVLARGRIERHGEVDDFKWATEGILNVRAVLESVRPWLGSVKLNQAIRAIDAVESSRVRGDAERCLRGHLYDRVYVRPDGRIHRICNTCDRMRERAERLSQGIVPRVFKHPERRLEDPLLPYAA
jgi:hypothetical protein